LNPYSKSKGLRVKKRSLTESQSQSLSLFTPTFPL
jgi:hypothetical protein